MKNAIKLLIILLSFTTSFNAQQFKLELKVVKNTYLVGEPLEAWIGVRNLGTSPVSGNFIYKMKLQLFNKNGTELMYEGEMPENFSPRSNSIQPGEEIYSLFEINSYFGKLYEKTAWHDHYLEPGEYTLKLTFNPSEENNQNAEVNFIVKEPFGEELKVYEAFLDIIKGEVSGKYSEIEVAERAHSLFEAHPNSVYSVVIFNFLDAVYLIPLQEYTKSKEVRKIIIEKYPSTISWRMLEGALKSINSDSERVQYLNKLKADQRGTIMEKLYDTKIKMIEKKEVK